MDGSVLYPRRAAVMVTEALADTRVVVVNGARQVGKSTLAQLIIQQSPDGRAFYLDDPVVRAAAVADPSGFVRHDGLLLIDEVQRVPELLLSIKRVEVPGLAGADIRDTPDSGMVIEPDHTRGEHTKADHDRQRTRRSADGFFARAR